MTEIKKHEDWINEYTEVTDGFTRTIVIEQLKFNDAEWDWKTVLGQVMIVFNGYDSGKKNDWVVVQELFAYSSAG